MKHTHTILAFSLLSTLAISSAALALELGEKIPESIQNLSLKNAQGADQTIKGLSGSKGKLLVITCNTCPYARAWEERLVAIGNEYQGKGIAVVAINSNDPNREGEAFGNMQNRVKAKNYQFPYLADSSSAVARALNATKTPEVFLFDAQDKLIYHGAIDDNSDNAKKVKKHYLREALDALLAGKTLTANKVDAVGCGIKFAPTKK